MEDCFGFGGSEAFGYLVFDDALCVLGNGFGARAGFWLATAIFAGNLHSISSSSNSNEYASTVLEEEEEYVVLCAGAWRGLAIGIKRERDGKDLFFDVDVAILLLDLRVIVECDASYGLGEEDEDAAELNVDDV